MSMDGLLENASASNLKKEAEVDVEFPQNTDEHTLTELDPHSLIERRLTELWEKLEETTENLNTCDDILETYFKTVTEKMKENRCPNCNKESSSKELEKPYEIQTSNPGNPKSLIGEISSSLLEIEKYITNNISNTELMFEEGTTKPVKANDAAKHLNVKLCQVLQEVLLKLKSLEIKVVPHITEPENISVGKEIEEEKKVASADDNEKAVEEGHRLPFLNDESEISSMVMVCVILSLVASALSTEIKENEKQQKRGIFGLGYGANLGYGIGIGNTGVLYSGSGLGVAGLGYSSLGLSGIGYGRSYGYAAAAPLAVAAAPVALATAPVAVAPVARTVVASAPFVSRVAFPVQAHVTATPITTHVATPLRAHVAAPLAVATPITAHVTAGPVHAHIAAPITAHAPVAAVTTHVATPVTHHVAAPVHITQPIATRITAPLSAPLTSVNIAYGRIGHGRALIH